MSIKTKLLVATLLGLAVLAPPAISEAGPLPLPASTAVSHRDVLSVGWRRNCNWRRCGRVWVGRRVYIQPRIVIRPRPVIRERVIIQQGGDMHTQWCLERYRSYNTASDTYVGYDGDEHDCISPYD